MQFDLHPPICFRYRDFKFLLKNEVMSKSKCKSDPQTYAQRKGSTFVNGWDKSSRWDKMLLLPSSPGVRRNRSRHDLLKSLTEITGEFSISAIVRTGEAAERRRHQEILDLTKEIEKLSSENIRLKEETFEADFNFMNMVEQLETKDNEIEELRTELSQLSEQISMSTAKEEEYINTARSCMNLEDHIETLQKELAIQKKDFDLLSSAHAACPSPEEMDSALNAVKSTFKTRLAAANDQLSERDQLIAELEVNIATKEEELKAMAGELTKKQSDYDLSDMRRQALETRLTEMDSVVQDRERQIGKMVTLMTRKSVKVNLLLQKIKGLEDKLEACQRQLSECQQINSSKRPATISSEALDFEHFRRSLENLQKTVKQDRSLMYRGAGDNNFEEDDSQGLLDETSRLQSDIADPSAAPADHDPARLLCKINNIKGKIRRKLDKAIQKRIHICNTIRDSRRQFDQAQSDIEGIRKYQQNAEESRKEILRRVYQQQRLSEIMECSENESRSVSAKITSFEKALKNLDNLEGFLVQTKNKA